jgi:hypothetical protein
MSKRIPTGKEYHIDSFEKMINTVNRENLPDFVMDLMRWMGSTIQMCDELRKGKSLTSKENEITGVVITNSKTGEQTRLDVKAPK